MWTPATVWRLWADNRLEEVGAIALKGRLLHGLVAAAIKTATHCIRLGIRSAKNDFLQKVASGHQASAKASDLLLKAAGIGRKFQKPFRCELPLLLDDEGKPTATQADRDDVWLKFFGRKELGVTKSISEIIATPQQPVLIDEELNWSAEVLPSILEVEAALRRTPARKSPGLDGIPRRVLEDFSQCRESGSPVDAEEYDVIAAAPTVAGGAFFMPHGKEEATEQKLTPTEASSSAVCSEKPSIDSARPRPRGLRSPCYTGLHLGSKKGCPVVFPAMYILAHLAGCSVPRPFSLGHLPRLHSRLLQGGKRACYGEAAR